MPGVTTFSATTAMSEQIHETLARDGCVVLTDLIEPHRHRLLAEELERRFADAPVCQGNFFGYATKRMSTILARSPIAASLAIDPTILGAMDAFLLKGCTQYQLNLTQAIQIGPGEPAQFIHADDLMFPVELPEPGQQKMINCMWAMDAFTRENGATNLVPGSHLWPRDRQPGANEIVPGEMAPGSVLVYLGSLLHGGGANRTQRPRTGLVISYCLGWLRQAENHYLALPRETVASFPPRLQKLLGYFVHEPNLGAVDGRDPIELIEGGPHDTRFEEFIPTDIQEMLGEHRASAA